MITKMQINKIENRYYIDENNRIIKETKLKNITLKEVISLGEIYELARLATKITDFKLDENNN